MNIVPSLTVANRNSWSMVCPAKRSDFVNAFDVLREDSEREIVLGLRRGQKKFSSTNTCSVRFLEPSQAEPNVRSISKVEIESVQNTTCTDRNRGQRSCFEINCAGSLQTLILERHAE